MNYHIFPANNFFEAYIEDIYALNAENRNIFWARGNRDDNIYLNTKRPITYIGNNEDNIVSLLKGIKSTDKLFVSWYDLFIGRCILKANIKCRLFVYLMGGDFYCDPPGHHDYWLFDRKTHNIVMWLDLKKIKIRYNPRNWHKTISDIKTHIDTKKNISTLYKEKIETIRRIDYIITAPDNNSELGLIKRLYPSFRAQHLDGVFEQNVDITMNIRPNSFPLSSKRPLKILLGNSATAENNHLDACTLLMKKICHDFELFVPLSYGDSDYSELLQHKMHKIIKDRFHPVLQYMERADYINFISSMDIVVMYHNRQQAYGNIVTALMLGKPVFLKKTNAVYATLKGYGITSLYNIDILSDRTIKETIIHAQDNLCKTRDILINVFSRQKRIQYISNIIQ